MTPTTKITPATATPAIIAGLNFELLEPSAPPDPPDSPDPDASAPPVYLFEGYVEPGVGLL